MSHTQEPWKTHDIDLIHNENNQVVAMAFCGLGLIENQELTEKAEKANARRIVACVNACAGIPTDELEDWSNYLKANSELRQQRDELLAALKEAVITYNQTNALMLSEVGMGVIDMNLISRATALVAKAGAAK